MTGYRFHRGETIVIMLEAIGASTAELSAVVSVSAELKPADNDAFVPGPDVAAVGEFAVGVREATDTIGGGWNLILPATASAALAAGTYVTNAVLTFDGGAIEKTEPLFLRIDQATA